MVLKIVETMGGGVVSKDKSNGSPVRRLRLDVRIVEK